MAPMMVGITDEEVLALAGYYAEQTPATASSGNPDLVAAGENLSAYCKACHGMQGKSVALVWPNLAGQQADYLQQQLSAFKGGDRLNTNIHTVLAPFGEAEFAALAAYYSQLSP
jgi:cytochrome c553